MTFPAVSDSLIKIPLGSLQAISLDTETTGLDPAKSRILELGAVRIDAGRIRDDDVCSVLVNPGVSIPPGSTRIHGIRDHDVEDAPEFPVGMAKFIDWAGPCLVVGYSIGFDLSVLEAEHERHDMNWIRPRSIDVQDLVSLIDLELPDFSLETVAESLGIDVCGRHRAVPDALLTASVLVELVPRLRSAGIQTFAQAERSCASIRARRGETGIRISDGLAHARGQSRASSNPYLYRVKDIMRSPPVSVPPHSTVAEAVAVMVRKDVGSVIVEEADETPAGILTERNLIQALGADGQSVLAFPVERYCSRPLITVSVKEFVYRAMGVMASNRTRHLGVTGLDGALVGIISARDALGRQAGDSIEFGREIDAAVSPAELGRIWAGLTTVAAALVNEGVDPRTIASVISRELRGLTGRAAAMAEAGVVDEHGSPPAGFAVMILGSGGRGESLLAMDQDNAIVFTEGDAGGKADNWCEHLGRRMSDILDEAGVSYCSGGVMASRPEWRMDVARWNSRVAEWMALSRPEDLLNADIFFDSMAVYGEERLADKLRRDAIGEVAGQRSFLRMLAVRATDSPSPFGWLGQPRLQRNRLDLKMHGLMPIFSAARVVALMHGIQSRSTADRLRKFRELDEVPEKIVDDLDSAHGILLGAILRQQLEDIRNGIPLSNSVAFGELDGMNRQQVIWALKRVPSIADIMKVPVGL